MLIKLSSLSGTEVAPDCCQLQLQGGLVASLVSLSSSLCTGICTHCQERKSVHSRHMSIVVRIVVRVASPANPGHGKEKSLSKPHLKAKTELLRFFLFQNLADSSTAESRSCQICDLTVVTTVTCQRVNYSSHRGGVHGKLEARREKERRS